MQLATRIGDWFPSTQELQVGDPTGFAKSPSIGKKSLRFKSAKCSSLSELRVIQGLTRLLNQSSGSGCFKEKRDFLRWTAR